MNRIVSFTYLVAVVLLASMMVVDAGKRNELDDAWMQFKVSYHKIYNNQSEEKLRRSVWEVNVNYIEKHNSEAVQGLHTYTVGVNEYADLTLEEINTRMTGLIVPPVVETKPGDVGYGLNSSHLDDVPDAIDWRDKGAVTRVKTTGGCGATWAFSAIGSLEGQWFRKTGKLVSLSEQNLVDCDSGKWGCNGGTNDGALKYIVASGGINTEESYPYEGQGGICRFNEADVGATCASYKYVSPRTEDELKWAVGTLGPISASINMYVKGSFAAYKDGIYDDPSCLHQAFHGVVVVGYGSEYGIDYWIVKNSWGTGWGIDGYAKMVRNKNNQCGIASNAVYPVIDA